MDKVPTLPVATLDAPVVPTPAPAPAPKPKAAPKAAAKPPAKAAAPPPHKTPEQRQRERDKANGYREEKNADGVVSYVALDDGWSTTSEETMRMYLATKR